MNAYIVPPLTCHQQPRLLPHGKQPETQQRFYTFQMRGLRLPPLPDSVQYLDCYNCGQLTALPRLPPKLLYLVCRYCPALRQLPPLPATVTYLNCEGCEALAALPPLPAALDHLCCYGSKLVTLPRLPDTLRRIGCDECTAFPDVFPAGAWLALAGVGRFYGTACLHPARHAADRHAADRRRVAAALPPMALLYV
jgi:hypothetical protein